MAASRSAESLAVIALADCGFDVSIRSSSRLEVADGDESFEVQVKVRRSTTYEWDVRALLASTSENVLLVVPRAAKTVILLAERDPRLSLVALDMRLVIWRGKHFWGGGHLGERAPSHSLSRRRPWGRWALMRSLTLSSEPRTQTALARSTGISQAAVSQALERLDRLVERTPEGWIARDRSQMWDTFMDEYTGAGGVVTHWYGLEPITKQADQALAIARASGIDALLSGDSAADRFAPWRIPAKGVVYARSALDMSSHAFGESEPGATTLDVVIPADRTLWATAGSGSSQDLVDPLVVAWDLRDSGGTDAHESVKRIKDYVLDGRARAGSGH